MNQYYLISQLPAIDGLDETSKLPIQVDEFKEVCSRFLSDKGLKTLKALSIVPDREGVETGSALVDTWNREERLLRLALAVVRAARMKKSFSADDVAIPAHLTQAAKTAVEMEDPLAAEVYLNRYRMERLDVLRPMDAFSEEAVYYYGLKLMLLDRMQKFDQEKGITSYQKIYNSILNGDNQEN